MVDCCRIKHPERLAMYTCWNLKLGARAGNFGSRIDYILSTRDFQCTNSDILPHLLGSDHCPVFADFNIASLNRNHERTGQSPKLSVSYIGRFRNKRTIHSLFISSSKEKGSMANVSSENGLKRPKTQTKMIKGPEEQTNGVKWKKKGCSKQQKIYSFFEKPVPDLDIKAKEAPEIPQQDDSKPQKIQPVHLTDHNDCPVTLQNSADQWKHIFTPPPPPRCKVHNEPCKMMTTKKNGINRGRSFWVCSRYVSFEVQCLDLF
jgi:AP endonuclease-2